MGQRSRTASSFFGSALVLVLTLAALMGATVVPRQVLAASATQNSAQTVEFVYLDEANLASGSTQNVVVSLAGDAEPTSGTLVVRNQDTGEQSTVASTATSGSAVLFSFAPSADGTYQVTLGTFALNDGSTLAISFDDCDVTARTFVVGSDGAAVTSVVTSDGEGNALESSSVAGALAALSANGIEAQADVGSDGILTIAIDPGHGGSDVGAEGFGAQEATLCWKIANYAADELRTYSNVNVVFTRDSATQPLTGSTTADDLHARVNKAVAAGADVLVSFHLNAYDSSAAHGSEVWVPNGSSYNYYTHTVGEELGNSILSKLTALGLYNRGIKEQNASSTYADGSAADYLAINRYSRAAGLTGILIENAFITSDSDYYAHLSTEDQLKQIGIADATGIAEAYHLTKGSSNNANNNNSNSNSSTTTDAVEGGIYRLYNQWSGEHLFTTSVTEYDSDAALGWTKEGVAWIAPSTGTPVYRLYNPYSGDHLYTTDADEYASLASIGWRQEGVAFYSGGSDGVAIYRLYNPYVTIGTHLYTTDASEYSSLAELGWRQEGVALYGVSANSSFSNSSSSSATSQAVTTSTPIMGQSSKSKAQMVAYFNGLGVSYPSVLADKGAGSIGEFVDEVIKAAEAEGVRADVMFAQAMLETGNLQFGGQVAADSCNFCGLKTGDGTGFATFDDVYTGLLAQAQHLKAYASNDALSTELVDPRFGLVTRGSATTVEALQGKWTPDDGYATSVLRILNGI